MESSVFWYLMCCMINLIYIICKTEGNYANGKEEPVSTSELFFGTCLVISGFIGTGCLFMYWVFLSPLKESPNRRHSCNDYNPPYGKAPLGYYTKPIKKVEKKVVKPKLDEEKLCLNCTKFDARKILLGRNHNNCNTWLGSNSGCPHNEEILKTERTQLVKRSKKTSILKKCQCNEHLGMGSNIKCPIHGEEVEALFGTDKKTPWYRA